MAEINIEKKKSPIWPWILLALIAAAIILFLLFSEDDDLDDGDMTVQETEQIEEMDTDDGSVTDYQSNDSDTVDRNRSASMEQGATRDYLAYIDKNVDMGLDHVYSSTAMEKLIAATRQQAEMHGVNVDADLKQAKEYAMDIKEDPMDTTHADKIKKAATSVGKAMGTIQKAKFPDLASNHTSFMAEINAIQPGTLTLDQKQDVKTMFNDAADLLTKMNK